MEAATIETITSLTLQGALILAVIALWREMRTIRDEQRQDYVRREETLMSIIRRMDEHEIKAEARSSVRAGDSSLNQRTD